MLAKTLSRPFHMHPVNKEDRVQARMLLRSLRTKSLCISPKVFAQDLLQKPFSHVEKHQGWHHRSRPPGCLPPSGGVDRPDGGHFDHTVWRCRLRWCNVRRFLCRCAPVPAISQTSISTALPAPVGSLDEAAGVSPRIHRFASALVGDGMAWGGSMHSQMHGLPGFGHSQPGCSSMPAKLRQRRTSRF